MARKGRSDKKHDIEITEQEKARRKEAFRKWDDDDKANVRRMKAILPEPEYQVWVGGVEAEKANVQYRLADAGFTVSKSSLETVLASMDTELAFVAALRTDINNLAQPDAEFAEGDVADVFAD